MKEIPIPPNPKFKTALCYCLKVGVPVVMMPSVAVGILVGICGKCGKKIAEKE